MAESKMQLIREVEIPREDQEGQPAKIPLSSIDPSQFFQLYINKPGVYLIDGKTQSGKSANAEWFFYETRNNYAWGICFSQSAFNASNLTFIHPGFKKLRYDPNFLRGVMMEQAKIPEDERPLIYIYFDDCISDLGLANDKVLFELVTQTKHYNAMVVITSQAVNMVPNYVRSNAFQVANFRMFTKGEVEACYDSYGQDFDSQKEFKRFVNTPLKMYEFAFYDRHHPDLMGRWIICKCPSHKPPAFMLKTGIEEIDNPHLFKKRKREERKKKRKSQSAKKRKVENNPTSLLDENILQKYMFGGGGK